MYLVSLEVIVSVHGDDVPDEQTAVAEATRYLSSYSEHFRDDAIIFATTVYDGDEGLDYGVSIQFDTPVAVESEMTDLMSHLENLNLVEMVEEIPA